MGLNKGNVIINGKRSWVSFSTLVGQPPFSESVIVPKSSYLVQDSGGENCHFFNSNSV